MFRQTLLDGAAVGRCYGAAIRVGHDSLRLPGRDASGMRTVQDISFPVAVTWVGGRLVRASVPGKRSIEIATPPEFKGTDEGVWSPEDFLIAAAACEMHPAAV